MVTPTKPGTAASATSRRVDELADELAQRLTAPVLLGRYALNRVIGRGSSGVVFAGVDRVLAREVAIKLFRSLESAAHIVTEAQTQARLNHPNIVAVHDFGRARGFAYLVMERVEGATLWERTRAGPLPWSEAVALFAQAGRGLAAAHRAEVLHGDIKPANILIGEDGRVRIADFGGGTTRAYMAPELWMNRDPDPRADQFSFCVTMWEAIYGARPWEVTVDCLLGTEPAKPVDPETIPEALERALRRGLSSQPRARFASMEALVRAIGRRWFPPRGRVARHGPQARWFSLPPGRSGRGF